MFKILIVLILIIKIAIQNPNYIQFHWKGKITNASVDFKVLPKYITNDDILYLYILPQNDINSVQKFKINTFNKYDEQIDDRMQHIKIENLQQNTNYQYFFSNQHQIVEEFLEQNEKFIFNIKTYKNPYGKMNFSFSIASCAQTGSENEIFNHILNQKPELFIQMGDLHYMDIEENNEERFKTGFQRVFNATRQNNMYQNIPIVYVWDDHDFGPNNSGADSPSKEASFSTYKNYVPHYDIQENSINQYFIVGQNLFILLDTRSYNQGKDFLGNLQIRWVLDILSDEKGIIQNINNLFLISGVHWTEDDWDDYEEERNSISLRLQEINSMANKQVLVIGGDAHMSGFDNGFNNPLGDYLLLVAGPMDKYNSCKGGQYIYGPYLENNQFAKISITEENCITIQGFRQDKQLFSYDTCNENDRKLEITKGCDQSTFDIFVYILLGLLVVVIFLFTFTKYYLRKSSKVKQNSKDDKKDSHQDINDKIKEINKNYEQQQEQKKQLELKEKQEKENQLTNYQQQYQQQLEQENLKNIQQQSSNNISPQQLNNFSQTQLMHKNQEIQQFNIEKQSEEENNNQSNNIINNSSIKCNQQKIVDISLRSVGNSKENSINNLNTFKHKTLQQKNNDTIQSNNSEE